MPCGDNARPPREQLELSSRKRKDMKDTAAIFEKAIASGQLFYRQKAWNVCQE